MSLCENGVYQFDGIHHLLKCKVNNDNCTFVRWCIINSCLTMTDLAGKCKYRGDVMSKRKNKDEFINEDINRVVEDDLKEDFYSLPKKSFPKTETCKVLWSKNGKIAVSFKGYGITIDGETDQKTIEVKYESNIGKSDFKAFI